MKKRRVPAPPKPFLEMSTARLGSVVFVVSLLVYGLLTPWEIGHVWPDADEPHYLLLTHSLVKDHDFDMRNNYERKDYKVFYPPDLPDTHAFQMADGRLLPIHDVGLSMLVAPGYAAAGRLGATLVVNVTAALLALGIFLLPLCLGVSRRAALRSWALFAFTSPLVVYSSQMYPEIITGALLVWAAYFLVAGARPAPEGRLAAVGFLLGLLPWFSVRNWPLLGVFGLVGGALLLRDHGGHLTRVALRALACLGAGFAVPVAAFLVLDYVVFGKAIPNAGYLLYMSTFRPPMFSLDLHVGLPGILTDRAFGVLPTAPIYIAAAAGLLVEARRRLGVVLLLVLPAATVFLFAGINQFWYGGWAPPLRYVVSALALMAPAGAFALEESRLPGVVFVAATWSLLITAIYSSVPVTRYTFWDVNAGSWSAFLDSKLGLSPGLLFPSFIRASGWDYALGAAWLTVAAFATARLARR